MRPCRLGRQPNSVLYTSHGENVYTYARIPWHGEYVKKETGGMNNGKRTSTKKI